LGTPSTSSISGTYQMKNGLVLTSDGSLPISVTSVYSQYYAPGDFDVQVDYALDVSWSQRIVPAGSNPFLEGAAFQVYFDGQSSLTLDRIRTAGADQLLVAGTVAGETFAASVPSADQTGTLRIRRIGTLIEFMSLAGTSWVTVGSWMGPVRPVVFGLMSANVNAMNSVTTTFRNFQINNGNTNFQPYQLPASPLARPDFVPGFVSADSIVWIVWGGATGYDPFSIMAANGIGRARIRATTISVPILENTPFSEWGTLPWNPSYWASLQVATQELLEAESLGMQTYMELFLSDMAADAGTQNAPAAWKGLSVDDTAAALQAYTYATASYLLSKGIKIDIWSPGTEIGTGILNFRPGERLPVPQNASPYDAIEFMEQNVWPIEAQLLKAAIAGIRQADPDAKIVLHIAGLTLSPADLWVKAFFSTMVNLGVPFDVAGVSLPYMEPGWTLPQYTTACWYQKLDAVFRDIAALGKKGIISEGAYQNTTVNISANAPMADFPITPQGQAAWTSSVLRFASNNPNVLGFNYTFPEAYPGVPGLDPPPVDIEAFSLFQNATTVQPGMLEFNQFLNTFKTPQIDGVVNLANSQPGPLAPGEYATAYGANLAGFTLTAQEPAYLPVLADVSVTVDGQPATLQYVSGNQINFLIPAGTPPGPATVVVSAGLQDSAAFTVNVQASALADAGSLGQVTSEGGWNFTVTAINLGTSAADVHLNFSADSGDPVVLPFSFPQTSSNAGPLLTSTLDQILNPNAQMVVESTGPANATTLEGWGQLQTDGSISGFGTFSNPTHGWNAVVPLETRNASSYILAFDNTGTLATGLAIANIAMQDANIPVSIRDDTGAQIDSAILTVTAHGQASFLLAQQYPATAGKRGTVEFDAPAGGQISVLGLRANGPALTTLPVMANVGPGGGSVAHVTYNGGFTSTFYLVNTGATSAQFTLKFFDDSGNPLRVPLSLPQTATNTTTSSLTSTLAAGATLVIQTEAQGALPAVVGSAQLTTTGKINGFEIFRWTTFGQEASVPMETRTPNSFILVFDDTHGLSTGVAVENVADSPADITVNLRDDTGSLFQTSSINLPARGHTSFLLPTTFPGAANLRGMVEFVVPAGGQLSVIGLRATADGTLTTIPALPR